MCAPAASHCDRVQYLDFTRLGECPGQHISVLFSIKGELDRPLGKANQTVLTSIWAWVLQGELQAISSA